MIIVVLIAMWTIPLIGFIYSVFYTNKHIRLIDENSEVISSVVGALENPAAIDRAYVYMVGKTPFKYGRGVSPIRCINSDIHKKYLNKSVKVWCVQEESDRYIYEGEEFPINCILLIWRLYSSV
ncbi:hypothetical protein [Microbulbifer variabilis]|uniref:hypothetical protein n=1 Tax=Microbulbifer variabilis TaxID=266805 RepID=UPI001CFE20CF|nr:hypothetical protein [Microbulbifer variabilis]